ncbi:hypothetical protein LL947_09230 [Halomonas sp. BLK-85]
MATSRIQAPHHGSGDQGPTRAIAVTGYFFPRPPAALRALALVALEAKEPLGTVPPFDLAVWLWMREAAAGVMGVLPLAMVIISVG